ncbi:MAG: glycosyltransferase family 4 protein [Chloroflexota bacterium]
MRILALIPRYHPAVGGAESHMGSVYRILAERGHNVTVLTTDALDMSLFWSKSGRRITELESKHESVRIVRFPLKQLPLAQYTFPATRLATDQVAKIFPKTTLVDGLTKLTPYVPAMTRWLQTTREQFDVVISTVITLEGIVKRGQIFAQQRGIPFVVYPLSHLGAGSNPAEDPISRFYTMRHQQQMIIDADGMIANNPAEIEFYLMRGKDESRIVLSPPALDFDRLSGGDGGRWRKQHNITNDTPLIVAISALTKHKGTQLTLAAMRQLWRQGSKAKLILAGSLMLDFEQALSNLPKSEQINLIMLGRISDQERNDLLAAADIFCMPSRVESFGMAFAEAMFYKKPVIGARVWGVNDFVIKQGKNGFVVDPDDEQELVDRLKILLEDAGLRKQMGLAGHNFVMSDLSWEKSVDAIDCLLNKVVSLNRGST